MTSKHFIRIAAILKQEADHARFNMQTLNEEMSGAKVDTKANHAARVVCGAELEVLQNVSMALAEEFEVFNENFDRNRFMVACGWE